MGFLPIRLMIDRGTKLTGATIDLPLQSPFVTSHLKKLIDHRRPTDHASISVTVEEGRRK
jgi:hypothetical protein